MSDAIPLRLLLVEDDPDTRECLVDVLELDGHRVETAGTVAEALAPRDWGALDAVVMDWRLPDGSAGELLPRMRDLAPRAAVVVVTGHADVEGAVMALRGGARDYLLKPVDADALRASLRRVAERKRPGQVHGQGRSDEAPRLEVALDAERWQAEERLLECERLAAVRQMINGLSHESRNALQRGQACLELLALELAGRPESLGLLAGVQRAQDRLHRLYEEVRSYAAPIDLHRQPCDVAALLRAAWGRLEPLDGTRCIQWTEEMVNGPELTCPVDRDALGQVFRHVLENAVAACPEPGEVTAAYRSGSLDGQPSLEVAIRDNGPGFSPEQQARACEPFYTTKTQGTGLGLAVVKRVVEAHGGRVRTGNAPGGGAEICITLPCGR